MHAKNVDWHLERGNYLAVDAFLSIIFSSTFIPFCQIRLVSLSPYFRAKFPSINKQIIYDQPPGDLLPDLFICWFLSRGAFIRVASSEKIY